MRTVEDYEGLQQGVESRGANVKEGLAAGSIQMDPVVDLLETKTAVGVSGELRKRGGVGVNSVLPIS